MFFPRPEKRENGKARHEQVKPLGIPCLLEKEHVYLILKPELCSNPRLIIEIVATDLRLIIGIGATALILIRS